MFSSLLLQNSFSLIHQAAYNVTHGIEREKSKVQVRTRSIEKGVYGKRNSGKNEEEKKNYLE